MEVVIGYRFQPSDEQLIMFLHTLRSWRDRCTATMQPYGTSSQRTTPGTTTMALTQTRRPSTSSRLIHSKNSCRAARVAGCGTWDGKAKTNHVRNRTGRVIGQERVGLLESEAKGKGHWIMHEYSLLPDSAAVCNIKKKINSSNDQYVICEIIKKDMSAGKKDKYNDIDVDLEEEEEEEITDTMGEVVHVNDDR